MLAQNCLNQLSSRFLGLANQVYRQTVPGLTEPVSYSYLFVEVYTRKLQFHSQLNDPVLSESKILQSQLALDLLKGNFTTFGLKMVDIMIPHYKTQLVSCLKFN